MLSDLFTSLSTPLSPHLRELGYFDEALDMRRRARLNQAAWQPHLDNTRRFILSTAEKCCTRDKVVLLGSGLLLDIPLDEFAAMFREVVLMDVVCLPAIRKRIARHSNCRFVEIDVTGTAERLYQNQKHRIDELPRPESSLSTVSDADLVVSLNILSQLWVVPRAFAGRRFPGLDPTKADEWCAELVKAHFMMLRSLASDVCLVADHECIKRDRGNAVISRASTVFDLELPEPDEFWNWNIAPISKENAHASKELTVGTWHFRK